MKLKAVAGGGGTLPGAEEPPRSTAYYYADLERIKRQNEVEKSHEVTQHEASEARIPGDDDVEPRVDYEAEEQQRHEPDDRRQPPNDTRQLNQHKSITENELSEYLESNEVINEPPVREVPPLRDRQWSLPEYNTPENSRKDDFFDERKGETYSTAGTFPMPEPKEKEPLLAELEVVGRVPLTQLEPGVRRSRSWYLCCPNIGDEEMSRESSWRYSSLRPVTAPPLPRRNGLNLVCMSSVGGVGGGGVTSEVSALRAERDVLSRALAAERARAAAAARAHDARLAELHGVIAELVRRRAQHAHKLPIPEELSDECESSTQMAGELDNDVDQSRTEQNDSSSLLSPSSLPTPQDKPELQDDNTDVSTQDDPADPADRVCAGGGGVCGDVTDAAGDSSVHLSERDSRLCLNTARCCQHARGAASGSGASCEREHGSARGNVCPPSPGVCERREAKLAARVPLRRAADARAHPPHPSTTDDLHIQHEWCAGAVERLALDVCAQADLREALAAAGNDGSSVSATVSAWRARCARLEADCGVLQCALARATDTAQRLSCACAVSESSVVSLCAALRCADRAMETYDVLLALMETQQGDPDERVSAERVARQLLDRLDGEQTSASIGEPLLSPGPWLTHQQQCTSEEPWSSACDDRLRAHAARLKSETVTLRGLRAPPHLFSYHDISEEDLPGACVGGVSTADMEAAVTLQEVLAAREHAALQRAAGAAHETHSQHKSGGVRARRRRERHWLEARASETEL